MVELFQRGEPVRYLITGIAVVVRSAVIELGRSEGGLRIQQQHSLNESRRPLMMNRNVQWQFVGAVASSIVLIF